MGVLGHTLSVRVALAGPDRYKAAILADGAPRCQGMMASHRSRCGCVASGQWSGSLLTVAPSLLKDIKGKTNYGNVQCKM